VKKVLFVVLGLAGLMVFAQEKEKTVDAKLGGFFNYSMFYDSRNQAEGVEGLFGFYPLDHNYNENNEDLNATPNINALAIATRLNGLFNLPSVFNAKTSILVEGDFTATSNSNSVRLRQAHAKFKWQSTELLVGRTWHPMFTTSVFPSLASLNTGAPFQSFNRSEQIRLIYTVDNVQFLGATVFQSDYKSLGPDGKSSRYLRNALLPNLHGQVQFSAGAFTLGAGYDFKMLKPRNYTDSYDNKTFLTDEKVISHTAYSYVKFKNNKLEIKAKAIYGQNLADHLMLGGYAVATLDTLTGKETYTSTNHLNSWVNVLYGKKLRAGFFAGYLKNLGTGSNIVENNQLVFARGANIDRIWRIAPLVHYSVQKWLFVAEYEITTVGYGDIDYADKALVKNTHDVTNNRVVFSMFYFF